ncbi:DUF3289 family protein [Salmonella enterica]|uniref:DUF3289 family protein n=1 Tax=Salmonella enterica TaxID=28901 RepID=UPI0032B82942
MRPWFTGGNITILPLLNKIIFNENRFINKTKNILDSEITSFLASSSQEEFDLVDDITHWLYSHWDVFKIWFVLQHYEKEGYEFKPFIHKIILDTLRRQGKKSPGA